MKKNYLLIVTVIAMALISIMFSSCKKEDDSKGYEVSAVVASNSINISEVKAIITDEDSKELVIATAPYKNNKFTIILPEEPNSAYRFDIFEMLRQLEVPGVPEDADYHNLQISDLNAKVSIARFEGYHNGDAVCDFYCYNASATSTTVNSTMAMYIYSDRNCNLTGSATETEYYGSYTLKWNANLQKGWNVLYQVYSQTGNQESIELTTTKPNYDLIWEAID